MIRTPLAVAAATATLAVLAAPAAHAAPARSAAAVAVSSSSPVAATGSIVTFRPTLHLPAGVAARSWTWSFGDKTSATGTGKPAGVRHTFHKAFTGSTTLTVTGTDGRRYTGKAAQVVSPLVGIVASGVTPLKGLIVSILDENPSDDSDGEALAKVRTDAHGVWYAPPSLPKAQSKSGYAVIVNADSDDSLLGSSRNPRFNILEIDEVHASSKPVRADLPRLVRVAGQVTSALPNVGPAGLQVTAVGYAGANRELLAATITDANGNYALGLGTGRIWGLAAGTFGYFAPSVTVAVGRTPVAAPPLVLQALSTTS